MWAARVCSLRFEREALPTCTNAPTSAAGCPAFMCWLVGAPREKPAATHHQKYLNWALGRNCYCWQRCLCTYLYSINLSKWKLRRAKPMPRHCFDKFSSVSGTRCSRTKNLLTSQRFSLWATCLCECSWSRIRCVSRSMRTWTDSQTARSRSTWLELKAFAHKSTHACKSTRKAALSS